MTSEPSLNSNNVTDIPVKLADEVARDLARDYLTEIGWFGEESLEANFIF